MNVSPRLAAAQAGRRRYVTGNPCKHGHVAERFTSSGGCVECIGSYARKIAVGLDTGRDRFSGVEVVRVFAHPDDAALVREFAGALLAARPAALPT